MRYMLPIHNVGSDEVLRTDGGSLLDILLE